MMQTPGPVPAGPGGTSTMAAVEPGSAGHDKKSGEIIKSTTVFIRLVGWVFFNEKLLNNE